MGGMFRPVMGVVSVKGEKVATFQRWRAVVSEFMFHNNCGLRISVLYC